MKYNFMCHMDDPDYKPEVNWLSTNTVHYD